MCVCIYIYTYVHVYHISICPSNMHFGMHFIMCIRIPNDLRYTIQNYIGQFDMAS